MAGRTISMHASEEVARRVEHLSRVEDRSPSQIASAALRFYLEMPPEAHTALRHVHALGSGADLERVISKIALLLLSEQYEISVRQMGRELEARGAIVPESEEELLVEGALLTARAPREG
jgi:hypothetical protein